MDNRFEIDVRLQPSEMLQQYPDIEYNRDVFVYEGMYGGIKILIDDRTLQKFEGSQCITDDHYVEEYLWFFFNNMFDSIVKLSCGEETAIGFSDSNNSITLKISPKKEILFSFDYGINGFNSNILDIPLPLEKYVQGVLNGFDRFLNILVEINPKVQDSEEVKELLEKRKQAENAYQKYLKNQR